MSSGNKPDKRSVLVVEDDQLLRELIVGVLNKSGFSAEGVTFGNDAVEHVAAHPDQVLLIDQQLPDMTGQEVISHLAMRGIRVCFVVMTGQGDERLAVDMMKFGARDYLVKDNILVDVLPGVMERVFASLESERLLQKAERALRESEQRFRTLFQDVPAVAVQGYKLDGVVCYWNKASERLYGYAASEAIGHPMLELIIPAAKRGDVEEMIDRIRQTGQVAPAAEVGRVDKAGNELVVFSSFVLLKGPSGERELFSIDVDFTSRRRAEQEREQLQSQLLQAQKMESVGRLAGGVAHDFNNMLGVIFGHTDLLLSAIDEEHPMYESLEEIRKAAQRSADLTRQLLAFARRQTAALKVLDINETVESVLKMLRRLIGEGIELSWLPGGTAGKVKMDPSQVDQILTNLCVNARDAIVDTGTITIETGFFTADEAYCKLNADAEPGDYTLVKVSDSGCGMSDDVRKCLFEPFFTTKPQGKGTGLGLATVYGIVRQNKGFVTVDSVVGEGSCFNVHLPHYAGTPDVSTFSTAAHERADGETILLVEDNATLLKMVGIMLKKGGFNVLAAGEPEHAITLAREHDGDIDLVLTDVIMPGMNGKSLSELVADIRPGIKILFMSGYTDDIISHHDISADSSNFIYKPFSAGDLIEKITGLIKVADDCELDGEDFEFD